MHERLDQSEVHSPNTKESSHGDSDGFVSTPAPVAELMTEELLGGCGGTRWIPDIEGSRFLFPGFGTGNLYEAVRRVLRKRELGDPKDVDEFLGIEQNADLVQDVERSVSGPLSIEQRDFLTNPPEGVFDFIIANPPFVFYNHIGEAEREAYSKTTLQSATGQFKLDHLFIEMMLRLLAPDGVLVTLSPRRTMTYTSEQSRWIQGLLGREKGVKSWLLPDWVFPNHTVDPAMTAVTKATSPTDSPPEWIYLEALYKTELESLIESDELQPPEDARTKYYDWQREVTDRSIRANVEGPFEQMNPDVLTIHKAHSRGEDGPNIADEEVQRGLNHYL